jgi:hypothetical protein
MNCRSSTNRSPRWLSVLSACCAAVCIVSTWSSAATAEDKPAPGQPNSRYGPPAAQPGAPQPQSDVRISGPVEATQAIPDGGSVLVGNRSAVDIGPPPASPEALQKRLKELQQQQEEVAKKYEETMRAMQRSLPRAAQIDIDRQQLQWKLAEAQAQIADFSKQQNRVLQERVVIAPLPDNAMLRAFTLKYVKPEEIGQALHNITGGGGPRIAVDERTNALVIAGTEKQMSVAEQLVQTLDQPGADQKGKSAETLQVRVVWIVDGLPDTEGKNVEPPYVSPQVLEGLIDLGFETPRVMCQQVSMLTLDKDRRRGQFHFQLPVLVQGNSWQLEGQGEISPADGEKYALQFNLNLGQPKKQDCQLGGSILTPLAHYNVLGTTTFVDEPQGGGTEQHLSAFVVYLDRAREFGEKKTTEKAR